MMCINSKYSNTITSDLLSSFTIDFFIKCIYMSSLYKDTYSIINPTLLKSCKLKLVHVYIYLNDLSLK